MPRQRSNLYFSKKVTSHYFVREALTFGQCLKDEDGVGFWHPKSHSKNMAYERYQLLEKGLVRSGKGVARPANDKAGTCLIKKDWTQILHDDMRPSGQIRHGGCAPKASTTVLEEKKTAGQRRRRPIDGGSSGATTRKRVAGGESRTLRSHQQNLEL